MFVKPCCENQRELRVTKYFTLLGEMFQHANLNIEKKIKCRSNIEVACMGKQESEKIKHRSDKFLRTEMVLKILLHANFT